MDQAGIEKYMERIHYSGDRAMNMDMLKKIHQLHPEYIPFENIDSYTGTVPSLDPENIFRKLVIQSRGGYCYEQNLLLRDVLTCLGFKVELRLARVLWKKEGDSSSPKSHLLLTAEIEGQNYLIDCGFGVVTLTAPLLLNDEEPQQTPNGLFKISRKDSFYTLWTENDRWFPIYRFVLEPIEPVDLEVMNWYVATHPGSMFKNNLVFSKVDHKARYTYNDNRLNIRWNNGGKESVSIENNMQLFEILKDTFGVTENAIEILKNNTGN
ncbi:arylamine N-acetyltransferase [Chryseobacterium sp.]|uniref:arylamine N-acetyltransferase family protein n=1 Tax=Chryseobacterium sp. TaxID=1871047 RepID=UPI0025C465F5|nr:arylamine N-acetyltransferase [Chryseobacterium sp.]MBV8325278.1 arylamine N-acetyltransferase [Chryseobacterium sp.]